MSDRAELRINQRDARFVPGLLIALAVLAIVSVTFMPRSHWELDEFLFRAGVESFEPLRHHPHPPGYPLLVGLGKAFTLIVGDPFVGMRALAILSTLIGFVALAAAVRNLTGVAATGIMASTLFYFSCAQLVHSTTPMSDPPALMFLFVGYWAYSCSSRGSAVFALIMGAALAASIGCRPQYAVAIVPGLFIAVAMTRSWRKASAGLLSFTIVCLTWLVPLVIATGGIGGFLDYQLGQAAYVAAHDAVLSRGWLTTTELWIRFVGEPWGGKGIWRAVLTFAVVGGWISVRRRMIGLVPVAAISVLHVLFTVATSDPADGVRYALAFQPLVAILAAVALQRLNEAWQRVWPAFVVAGLLVAMSIGYVWPILEPRARGVSPPLRAIEWIEANVRPDAVILYDNSLRPHAESLLGDRVKWPIEDGMREVWNREDLEVWVLADGLTAAPGARVFDWTGLEWTEEGEIRRERSPRWLRVYRRITRNHYGVVSVIPMRPHQRYLPGEGVYPIERSPRREEWRWLDVEATIEVPPGHGRLAVSLHVPKEHPEPEVSVTVHSGDAMLGSVRLARNEAREVVVDFQDDGGDLTIRSSTSYDPREHGARDARALSIQLLGVRREAGPPSSAMPPIMMVEPKE